MTTAPPTAARIATTPLTEGEQAISVIVLAFDTDPLARWMSPHPQTYLARSPVGMWAFGGRAFAAGTAHHVEGFQGAALWLPPGIEPDQETLMAEFERHVAGERLPTSSYFRADGERSSAGAALASTAHRRRSAWDAF